jgi:hypothetical protein
MLCRKLTLPPSPFTPFVNGFSSNKIVYAVVISAEIWAYRENIQHAAEIHILHSTRKFVFSKTIYFCTKEILLIQTIYNDFFELKVTCRRIYCKFICLHAYFLPSSVFLGMCIS